MLLAFIFFTGPILAKNLTYQQLIFGNGSYNKNESPYDVAGEFVKVYIYPSYFILANVEENQQLVSYLGCMNYTWKDVRLAYNVEQFNESDYQIVPTSILWLPYLYCYNWQAEHERSNIEVKMIEKMMDSDDALIYPDGTVSAFFRARFDTICQCDISAFPFDTQFCVINFDGGWADLDRMNFYPYIDLATLTTIGTPEWNIEFYNATNLPENVGYNYISMTIIYKLKRNSEFYFYFMILPTLTITCTCLAALLLPSSLSYGEKTTIGITGLLGLTFLLSILVSEVPRSKKLPLIGKWLLIEMFISIFAIGMTVPLDKLKKRFFEKPTLGFYAVDIIAFLIIFGANALITIFMLVFPGDLKTEPQKYF